MGGRIFFGKNNILGDDICNKTYNNPLSIKNSKKPRYTMYD